MDPSHPGCVQNVSRSLLPSEEANSAKRLRTFTLKSRPESGLDCLVGALFARQRLDSIARDDWTVTVIVKVASQLLMEPKRKTR